MLLLVWSVTFSTFFSSVLQMFHHHRTLLLPLPFPPHHHTSQHETTERVPTYLQDWGGWGVVGLMDEGGGGEVLGESRNLELNINRW